MTISNKKRFEILRRDGFKCTYCGAVGPTVELEVDHIVPRSKGGNDEDGNLTTSCFACNRGKSDMPVLPRDSTENEKTITELLFKLLGDTILADDLLDEDEKSFVQGLNKYGRKAIEDCFNSFPVEVVCLTLIGYRERVSLAGDGTEIPDLETITSILQNLCKTVERNWSTIEPSRIIFGLEDAEHDSMCRTYYDLSEKYEMTPKQQHSND